MCDLVFEHIFAGSLSLLKIVIPDPYLTFTASSPLRISYVSLKKLIQLILCQSEKNLSNKLFVIQNFMEIWYMNLRKSLEIQTSLIFSNV